MLSSDNNRLCYFLVPGDINTLTGGYRYDKRIIQELRSQGYTVILISLLGNYPFPDSEQLNSAEAQLASLPDQALVIVDGLAFGVMHDQLIKHRQRLKLVALVHHPLALETGLSQSQADRLFSCEKNALGHARHIITTSDTTTRSLNDYGVAAQRITTVCPGTDMAPIASGSSTTSHEKPMNLLCVATITQRKGHLVLLDALSRVRGLEWHLNCVGSQDRDPTCSHAVAEQCRALELEQRVSLLGELNTEELEHQYQQADVLLLASFHEGYGMVLDEAIAHGLPIIATNAGAIAKTVLPGTGLLVPPGDSSALADAISVFLTDSNVRSQLTESAREARDQLRSWSQAAEEFALAIQVATRELAQP